MVPSTCFLGLGADVGQLLIRVPQQDPTAPGSSVDCPVPLPPSGIKDPDSTAGEGPAEDRVAKGSGVCQETGPPSKSGSFWDKAILLQVGHHCHLCTEEASLFFISHELVVLT